MIGMKPRQSDGYTIIELLISISITVLMMFLINRLFFDTTAAVGRVVYGDDVREHFRRQDKHFGTANRVPLPVPHRDNHRMFRTEGSGSEFAR